MGSSGLRRVPLASPLSCLSRPRNRLVETVMVLHRYRPVHGYPPRQTDRRTPKKRVAHRPADDHDVCQVKPFEEGPKIAGLLRKCGPSPSSPTSHALGNRARRVKRLAEPDQLRFETPQAGKRSVKKYDRWPLSLLLVIQIGALAPSDRHNPAQPVHRHVGSGDSRDLRTSCRIRAPIQRDR